MRTINDRILMTAKRTVEIRFTHKQRAKSYDASEGLVKKYRGGGRVGGRVGRSREGVGHEVLSLVQGVGRAIFSYP